MLDVLDIQYENSIRYGMTYEQYWFGCPEIYYIYEKVYKEKLKEKDFLNWQAGVYVQYAVASCLDSKIKYPSQPLFYAYEKPKPATLGDMMEKFNTMVTQVNKKFN